MMKPMKRLCLLLALCLLAAAVPATADEIVSAPVDAAVGEVEPAELWTEEIARDVAEDEAKRAAGANAPEAASKPELLFSREGVDYRIYDAAAHELAVCGCDPDFTWAWIYQGFTISGNYWKVTAIDIEAFQNKPRLQNVTVVPTSEGEDNLTGFDAYAFYGSTAMEKIHASDKIYDLLTASPYIGLYEGGTFIFATYVDYTTGIFGALIFESGTKETSLTIPAEMDGFTVRGLADSMFTQSEVQHVTMPDTLRIIGEWAFCESQLVEADIPEGVVRIGQSAFSHCQALKTAKVPGSVEAIPADAFRDCPALEQVVLGDGVKTVAAGAFLDNPALKSIVIPASVESIGGDWSSVNPGMVVRCAPGSYAEQWAQATGFPYDSGTGVIYPAVSIEGAKVTVKNQTYTGKAIKPEPKVVFGGAALERGVDYEVSYKNNKKIGTATLTVTGMGHYTGSVQKTFKINPKKVALSSLTAGKKKLTAKWKKTAGGAGYQIQYSQKKSFSTKKTVTITANGTVKKVLKNLKSGKVYYVHIRGYKKVGGKAYYGAWSKAKSVKVK